VKKRFQSLPFKCNLQRYSAGKRAAGGDVERRGSALHVECSWPIAFESATLVSSDFLLIK
jgi:hypothetical protein